MATPEAEAVVTVHPDTRTVLEADSGTSQPGHNIKHPTLTMEAPQWGRDSGDTWTTMNRCQNGTHVSFSSPHRQRNWGQGPVDNITLNSASTACSARDSEQRELILLKKCCNKNFRWEPDRMAEVNLQSFVTPSSM